MGDRKSIDYDRSELWESYKAARGKENRYASWRVFRSEYGENAGRDFINAVDNGDIEVIESKHGIRSDGHWPRYNKGRLWIRFNYSL